MTDSRDPKDLVDSARDWKGPLVNSESPPLVPGMGRVPAGPAPESTPKSFPPPIAQEAQ